MLLEKYDYLVPIYFLLGGRKANLITKKASNPINLTNK
jgi:hypothetical protein